MARFSHSIQIVLYLLFLIHLVPAKVENGHALRKNVQELALFMEVVTTPHLIRKHMHFKDSVAILL